jgi:ParB-like chromosome segregation protein Spo0J
MQQLKDLKANPKNPRTVSPQKLEMLKKSLAEFGDLGGIVFNTKTGFIVGGHQRAKMLNSASVVEITKKYSKPTSTGTTAEGYVIVGNERYSYREVKWEKAREQAANIAANKGAGEWDLSQLSEWMKELKSLKFDLDLTMYDENELTSLLQDIEKINSGSENDEWARMGGEDEFIPGKNFITLAIHFPSKGARDKFVQKTKVKVYKKLKNIWAAKPC